MTIRRASPLLLARPASTRASISGSPSPSSSRADSSLLGTSAKMPASWASESSADLGAEEDLGGPLGRGQALVAVDQPGQFGGQPPLGRPPAGIGLRARPSTPSISAWSRSVKNRRHLPTSASSRLIQYW